MGRLIDADKCPCVVCEDTRNAHCTYEHRSCKKFCDWLNNTAYDTEKVVEQLEEHRANFDCRSCKHGKTEKQVCTKDCTDSLIDGLLEIVRRGGAE